MQTNTINIQIESCFMSLKLLSVQYKSKVIQIMKKINANVNVNKQKKHLLNSATLWPSAAIAAHIK